MDERDYKAMNKDTQNGIEKLSAQEFCEKAERFVRWLDKYDLDSYYIGGELYYYYTTRLNEKSISASTILEMFLDSSKNK